MAFCDTDINYVSGLNPLIEYKLKVRKYNQADYIEKSLVESGFSLERAVGQVCSSLQFYTSCPDTDFNIGSEVELWASLGPEQKLDRIFSGFIIEQTREWPVVSNTALDRCEIFRRSTAEILLPQSSATIIENAQLVAITSAGEGLWGLDRNIHPNGFDNQGNRRSWAVAPVVISDAGVQLAPDMYYTDFSSGLIRIYSQVSTPILDYCRPLIEGTNDIKDILTSLITYPQSDCGAGIIQEQIDFSSTGVDLPIAIWRKHNGTIINAWEQLRRELSEDWWLSYRADTDKFYLRKLEASIIPRFKLVNIVKSSLRTNISDIATDVIVTGILDRPDNYACNAYITDLQAGEGEIIRWIGNSRQSNPSGSNILTTWSDANPNTGLGHSSNGYTAGTWYPLLKLDLGSDRMIGELRIAAANSLNPGSLKQDNINLIPAYKLFGSIDDINYFPLCANQPLETLPLESVSISESLMPKLRFIKVIARAYCDTNSSKPSVTLNEIGVFEPSRFASVARAQNTEVKAPYYYPQLLNTLSRYGRSIWIEATGNQYGEIAANKLAQKLLTQMISPFPKIYITTITNPILELGDTVQYKDAQLGYNGRVLIERISLTPELTKIVGKAIDYEE